MTEKQKLRVCISFLKLLKNEKNDKANKIILTIARIRVLLNANVHRMVN